MVQHIMLRSSRKISKTLVVNNDCSNKDKRKKNIFIHPMMTSKYTAIQREKLKDFEFNIRNCN